MIKFDHKIKNFLDLYFVNIFFLSTSFIIYLHNYVYHFQIGKLNFIYFNLINFIIIPIIFSSYFFIKNYYIYKFFFLINIFLLSFISSRILFFYLINENFIFLNQILLFSALFFFYLFFIYFYIKKIEIKKKIFLTFLYILILFLKFPYNYLVENNFSNKDLDIQNLSKPPIIVIVLDELSRQFIIGRDKTIKKKYLNLNDFEKKNLNFSNAQSNYALSNHIFYSIVKGKIYPSSVDKNIIHFLNIEKDKDNLFNDFYKNGYKINIFSHLIFCKNEKFLCEKPISNNFFFINIYKKIISYLIPDDVEAKFFPYLFQKKLDYQYFKSFENIDFENNNFYFFHSLIAHKPWVVDTEENYINTQNYKFKESNKKLALKNYDMGILNLDKYIGNFFFKLKQKGLYDSSTIIILSDHGICYEFYCRNRVEKLSAYDDYLSNVVLMAKHENYNGVFKKKFDTINFRKFISDLILENSFSLNSVYKNYKFYNNLNLPINKK